MTGATRPAASTTMLPHTSGAAVALAVLAAAALVASAPTALAARDGTCSAVTGIIIGENQIAQENAKSAADCCDKCNANAMCVAYTFDTSGSGNCFLKDNVNGNKTASNRVSGTNGRQPWNDWNACTGKFASFPFCDTSLSLDDRLNDLVNRIPIDSIGQQLTARQSPAIADLGLPAYYWGTNAIHGMQNVNCLADGQCPTSFPAPCALSATFNMSLVFDMGEVIGTEERAYYNNQTHDSLDTWSPTINLNRDPRWGRNVESPGEDPLVCGSYGAAYAQGLQGNDTVYRSMQTTKHWVAYSVENYNGVTRHTFDAEVSAYDLADSYFPGFKRMVQEGGAMGVMCSYNELNGKPTCGNPDLTATLREDWGFQGYITSDSDSIHDIWASHHYEPNATLATRDGLEAGCDIDSGGTYSGSLAVAVNSSVLDIKYAHAALYRSYKMRFLMGLFDPNITNPYRSITTDVVGSAENQAKSLMASRKSMVLLKNDGPTLPFKTGGNIALIGISVADGEQYLGNYNGPICNSGGYSCVPTIEQQVTAMNTGGNVTTLTDVSDPSKCAAAAKAADYVIFVASNFKDGGGEGQDRYDISLEASQKAAADAVMAVGKPTALVLINGGIIAIDDLKDTAPAIVEAFMPGVHGAQAVAETLFGANNPGGKMPVTMYHSTYVDEIDFLNMSMTTGPGRSYRYYTGTPLFPFGYGLSYTTFTLDWTPPLPPRQPPAVVMAQSADATTYNVTVKNTGSVAGDEVVLAFFKPQPSAMPGSGLAALAERTPVPIKQLFGFQRVTLAAGQSVDLTFELNATALALVDEDGHRSLHGGVYNVEFSRGHGDVLAAPVRVDRDAEAPERLETFRKWW